MLTKLKERVMEKKINVAELLKDCPKGMELDCTMYDNVTLEYVSESSLYPIRVRREDGNCIALTKYGQFINADFAKCVIFHKGKTTWEGFVPPCKFNYGDIVVNASNKDSNAFIYAGENDKYYKCYVGLATGTNPALLTDGSGVWVDKKSGIRLATEEEKEKLFKAIKDSGYKWNAETKTLERLVEPKFKVGDKIRPKNQHEVRLISEVWDNYYLFEEKNIPLPFSAQDDWELVPNKFDLSTLVPFESKVLVRDDGDSIWQPCVWGIYEKEHRFPYITTGNRYRYCIPYKGNEHLLGKIGHCDEYYKTWKD